MTAIDLACRHCAAQPGEQCHDSNLDQYHYLAEFHQERVLDAAGIGFEGAYTPTDEEFDKGAEAALGKMGIL